ncbi:unnamed protein product [Didymodactylos carnosus]|uniref:Uncharacterized protein n=1 Tax=Didymodactylos carnosus TaxID=1234261 RepID=A0A814E0M1_9BILA|nr:unnamed protein product [Didymodactylos carnosus]CAF3739132.1 unnamed protein product [Didymodactylos carnosus]
MSTYETVGYNHVVVGLLGSSKAFKTGTIYSSTANTSSHSQQTALSILITDAYKDIISKWKSSYNLKQNAIICCIQAYEYREPHNYHHISAIDRCMQDVQHQQYINESSHTRAKDKIGPLPPKCFYISSTQMFENILQCVSRIMLQTGRSADAVTTILSFKFDRNPHMTPSVGCCNGKNKLQTFQPVRLTFVDTRTSQTDDLQQLVQLIQNYPDFVKQITQQFDVDNANHSSNVSQLSTTPAQQYPQRRSTYSDYGSNVNAQHEDYDLSYSSYYIPLSMNQNQNDKVEKHIPPGTLLKQTKLVTLAFYKLNSMSSKDTLKYFDSLAMINGLPIEQEYSQKPIIPMNQTPIVLDRLQRCKDIITQLDENCSEPQCGRYSLFQSNTETMMVVCACPPTDCVDVCKHTKIYKMTEIDPEKEGFINKESCIHKLSQIEELVSVPEDEPVLRTINTEDNDTNDLEDEDTEELEDLSTEKPVAAPLPLSDDDCEHKKCGCVNITADQIVFQLNQQFKYDEAMNGLADWLAKQKVVLRTTHADLDNPYIRKVYDNVKNNENYIEVMKKNDINKPLIIMSENNKSARSTRDRHCC